MPALRDILALREGGVLSIVGAGGKTTLMFRLAAEIASSGERVLTTTTTKIFMPQQEQSSNVIIASNLDETLARTKDLLARGLVHLTAAKAYISRTNKLQGFDAPDIDKLQESGLFQWILVEADGAAGRPLKAPAAHEPVIPFSSRWVFAMVGLDALGQPLSEEWVFRSSIFAGLTGLPPGESITEESVASVLTHEAGMMKGSPEGACRHVFLNKAETEKRRASGRKIAGLLRERSGLRIDKVVIGSLEAENPKCECYDLSPEASSGKGTCP